MNEYWFQLAITFLLVTVFLNGFAFTLISQLNAVLPVPMTVWQKSPDTDANYKAIVNEMGQKVGEINPSQQEWYYNLPILGPVVYTVQQMGIFFVNYMTAFGSLISVSVAGFKVPLFDAIAISIGYVLNILQLLSIAYIIKELVLRR